MGRKSPKTHQREIPLGTPCFDLLYRVAAQVGPGPGGADWMAWHISGQPLLRCQLSLPPPGPQERWVAASPGRCRPGCATSRAENGSRAYCPSSDKVKESPFPSWHGSCPSARTERQPLTAWINGVDSTRRGKAPPLAGFRPFCPVKMDPSGASPRLASLAAQKVRGGERRCDGVSETCPASQGRGEGYSVHTDESEGLTSTGEPTIPQSACRLTAPFSLGSL